MKETDELTLLSEKIADLLNKQKNKTARDFRVQLNKVNGFLLVKNTIKLQGGKMDDNCN